MDWKAGTPLGPDQTNHPVEVLGHLKAEDHAVLPEIDRRWCLEFWGDSKATSRFKTWGHRNGKLSAHFICARGGVPMHTDIGFARYSVHIQLYNGGYFTHGLDADPQNYPLFEPGLITLLDTHSPHQVSRDPRLIKDGTSKVAAAIDFFEMPADIPEAIGQLLEHLPAFPG
jgi:hypothetical protein